jgi:ring-1,2-phenylacetyl-CoA epoxidase subunit PaaD
VSAATEVRAAAQAIADPEIPVLTLGDLGIVREVQVDGEHVVIHITPTYSGCPALDPIRHDVESAVRARGYADVEIRTVLAPAWSTDWISDQGRRKLEAYGIAPPDPPQGAGCPLAGETVRCPRCGSRRTEQISRFGATPCQAHFACLDCGEPFDQFKTLR